MTKVQKRTFSLTPEQAAYIDKKVASGDYVSSSEVVREGLRAMQERDAAIESWLREEVGPSYDYMRMHPEAAVTLDAAFDRIETKLKGRIKATD